MMKIHGHTKGAITLHSRLRVFDSVQPTVLKTQLHMMLGMTVDVERKMKFIYPILILLYLISNISVHPVRR